MPDGKELLLTNLCKLWENGITETEKDIRPYWTPESKEYSDKLWLPTKMNSYEDTKIFPVQKSWFDTERILPLTIDPSWYQSVHFPKSSKEKDTPITTIKIRIFPSKSEKDQLNRWFGMFRYTYNNTLVALKVLSSRMNPVNWLITPKKFDFQWYIGSYVTEILDTLHKFTVDSVGDENLANEIMNNASKKINRKKKCTKGHSEKSIKLNNMSVRRFVEKVQINDSSEFFVDQSKSRREILRDFIKTMDDPKYFYDESKTEKTWSPEWCTNFPVKMFRGAINLLTQDINSGFSNGNFELNMRLKTKKDKRYILNSDQWNTERIPFPSELNGIRGYYRVGRKKISLDTIFGYLQEDSSEQRSYQIIKDEFGKYYLNIPVSPTFFSDLKETVKEIGKTQTRRFSTCSLDPGVRTFMTLYGVNHVMKIGEKSNLKIYDLLELEDLYKSKLSHELTRKMNKIYKKKVVRNRRRIKGLVDELHRKTISFLTSNYETILLPDFRVSEMVTGKKISKVTKRQMLALRFYVFKQRLFDKCTKKDVDYKLGSEAYTTKTCSECGHLTNVGGSEIYACSNSECPMYEIELDRDVHASRNYMIRCTADAQQP